MKKRLVQLIVGGIILLIVAVFAITLFLDRIIKAGVETVGPQIAKVDVKLASVSRSLFSGKGEINGLVVGNPQGFQDRVGNQGRRRERGLAARQHLLAKDCCRFDQCGLP